MECREQELSAHPVREKASKDTSVDSRHDGAGTHLPSITSVRDVLFHYIFTGTFRTTCEGLNVKRVLRTSLYTRAVMFRNANGIIADSAERQCRHLCLDKIQTLFQFPRRIESLDRIDALFLCCHITGPSRRPNYKRRNGGLGFIADGLPGLRPNQSSGGGGGGRGAVPFIAFFFMVASRTY